MRNFLLYGAVTIGIILFATAIYFGSLLPLAKSRAYIAAERNLSNVKSVPEFIANFDRVMKFPSPVGSEEAAKFLGGKVLDVLGSVQLPEKDTRALAEYIDGYLFKTDVRHLMIGGHLWNILWTRFHRDEYFAKSEAHFQKAHEIGPRLPTPLYALYMIYRSKGDEEKADQYKNEIERLWPQVKDLPEYFGK